MNPASPAQATVRTIDSVAEAEQLLSHLTDVMDALLAVVQEETTHVRAGRMSEVARLEPVKTDLARLYLTDVGRVKENKAYLARTLPERLAKLRARHDSFHALLQVNLTMLATVHAVSESIVRGVSAELARKTAPQTYGAHGQNNVPNARTAVQPMTLSRSL